MRGTMMALLTAGWVVTIGTHGLAADAPSDAVARRALENMYQSVGTLSRFSPQAGTSETLGEAKFYSIPYEADVTFIKAHYPECKAPTAFDQVRCRQIGAAHPYEPFRSGGEQLTVRGRLNFEKVAGGWLGPDRVVHPASSWSIGTALHQVGWRFWYVVGLLSAMAAFLGFRLYTVESLRR